MPKVNQLHVDQLLSQISVKYMNSEYIASSIFPMLPVQKDSDLYRVFVRNFRIPETKRANRGLALEHDFDVTSNSYLLEKHALMQLVSDDDARNYDIASLRADMAEELTDKILARREKTVADLMTTTNWSLNVSLATAAQFSLNTTTSNPIPTFDTGATTIIQNSGFKPVFAVMDRTTFINIKNHVSVLDRIKFTSAEVNLATMKGLFDLPEILVGHAVEDTSALGLTEVISNLWPDNVFIGYKPPRPSPLKPSSGYIFQLNKPMVKRFRVEDRQSEQIEVEQMYSARVVASLSGYLIRDTQA